MKRITKLLLLFTLVGVLTGGCELLTNTVKVDSDTYYYDFVINPTEAGPYSFSEQVISTDINQLLDDNNVKREKIKSVKISAIRAVIISAHTFDILDSGEIYLGSGTTKTTMAWWPVPVPAGSTDVPLDASSDDFKDLILQDTFTIGGSCNLSGPLTTQAMVQVWFEFELEFKLIGKS